MLQKRILSTLLFVMAALLLGACSGGKPESTIDAFYRAAAKGDVEAATKLMSFANVPAAKMVQAKGKVQMIVGEMQTRIQANDGLDTMTVVQTQTDEKDENAVVLVELRFKNGKTQKQNHRLIKEDGSWKLLLQ
ncbi:DUF4878 domain-containing protein [Pseudomonas aeruginosa]